MTPEQKQAKLNEAIARGYIKKHIDPDGIVRYELTPSGVARWIFEQVMTPGKAA